MLSHIGQDSTNRPRLLSWYVVISDVINQDTSLEYVCEYEYVFLIITFLTLCHCLFSLQPVPWKAAAPLELGMHL